VDAREKRGGKGKEEVDPALILLTSNGIAGTVKTLAVK